MSLVKSTATIGSYTLISRVLGFIRDVTIASSLGASWVSDAFFVAFKIPNFLRRLFAEGAFNSAFVPMYAGMRAVEGESEADAFAGEALSFLVAVLLIVSALFIFAMPWLMYILAPGFESDPAKYELSVLLTRITMPYIVFISVVSLLGGVLNSLGKFAAVAATPILMNICLIVIPPLIAPWTPTQAHGLAVAVCASGVVQMLWLIWFAHRAKVMPRLRAPRLTARVKKMLRLIAPAALGAGVAQINLFVDLIIASHLDNAVSYLYYADRINELPLAVIGIAVGTALLPMLSRQIREGNTVAAHHSQNRAIELALLMALPASAALMVISEPVIRVLYERGEFGALETAQTHLALIAFAAGLPSFVLIKVLAPGFFAHEDTKTPFKIATLCIFVNFALNLLLMIPLAHVGMALATTISGWLNAGLMAWVLHRRRLFVVDRMLLIRLPRLLAACGVMVVVLIGLERALWGHFSGPLWAKALALAALVTAGGAAYGAAVMGLRAVDLAQIKRVLKRAK